MVNNCLYITPAHSGSLPYIISDISDFLSNEKNSVFFIDRGQSFLKFSKLLGLHTVLIEKNNDFCFNPFIFSDYIMNLLKITSLLEELNTSSHNIPELIFNRISKEINNILEEEPLSKKDTLFIDEDKLTISYSFLSLDNLFSLYEDILSSIIFKDLNNISEKNFTLIKKVISESIFDLTKNKVYSYEYGYYFLLSDLSHIIIKVLKLSKINHTILDNIKNNFKPFIDNQLFNGKPERFEFDFIDFGYFKDGLISNIVFSSIILNKLNYLSSIKNTNNIKFVFSDILSLYSGNSLFCSTFKYFIDYANSVDNVSVFFRTFNSNVLNLLCGNKMFSDLFDNVIHKDNDIMNMDINI